MSNLTKRDDDEDFIETEDVQTFVSLASLNSRDFLAKFVMARQDCGERIRDVVKTMNSMNIKVSERSLYRYASNMRTFGSAIKDASITVPSKVLTEAQIAILIGWVLTQNHCRRPVSYVNVMQKSLELFSIKIGYQTCRMYMEKGGITLQKLINKGPDSATSLEEVYETMMENISELRGRGILDGSLKKNHLVCIDFIHDSHWNHQESGLGGSGRSNIFLKIPHEHLGLANKGLVKHSEYTSCFIVANRQDGKILPTIMFTIDPRFKEKAIPMSKFRDFGIHPWQIRFVGGDSEGKISRFTAERKDFTLEAIILCRKNLGEHFGMVKNLVFLSDNGASFKIGSESIFKAVGAKDHGFFASKSHAYSSTLDNGTNATTKSAWRTANSNGTIPYTTQPESALNLMKGSQSVEADTLKGLWNRNLLMDVDDLENFSFDAFKQRFNATPPKWVKLHKACREEYANFTGKKGPYELGRIMGGKRQKNTGLNPLTFGEPVHQKRLVKKPRLGLE